AVQPRDTPARALRGAGGLGGPVAGHRPVAGAAGTRPRRALQSNRGQPRLAGTAAGEILPPARRRLAAARRHPRRRRVSAAQPGPALAGLAAHGPGAAAQRDDLFRRRDEKGDPAPVGTRAATGWLSAARWGRDDV